MKIIPKGDVYRLIVNSKLPTVERFKNWVFNGILSNINESSNDKGLQSPEEALVKVENNQVVTDSRSVADHFGKQHKDVLRAIENLVRGDHRKIAPMFYETTMPDSYGRQQKAYFMNRDGFSLLVMGFTGKKALEWKLKYIEAFNGMERKLANRSTINPAELSLRKDELAIRKAELYLRIADNVQIPEYKQIINSLAVEAMSGKMYLPLPEVNKKTFSATDIGNILGVSSNKIGRLSKQLGMKIPEYGKFFYDKAKGCNKQVETFRYYENAIDVFRKALQKDRGLDESMG